MSRLWGLDLYIYIYTYKVYAQRKTKGNKQSIRWIRFEKYQVVLGEQRVTNNPFGGSEKYQIVLRENKNHILGFNPNLGLSNHRCNVNLGLLNHIS